VTGRRGRRRKQLLDDLMERRGRWKLKEKVLARMLWRTRFGRESSPAIKRTTVQMSETIDLRVVFREDTLSSD
jgi:hypothetical protein